MLLHLIVVLALAVAALYGFIGLYVVPKLARLADRTNGLIRAAQYGAAAFFVGCAMTHIALAEHMLSVPELVEGHEWAHLLPHLLQVVGGTTFALIAWLSLDVRLRTKEEALLEAEGARLREQLERSQRLNGLGQLAGGVAHDFNNLLAVIGGYGRLLDRRLGDRPELRADAREIVTAAERGAELTRQMLVFSRGSEREVEVGDVNRAIEGSETLLRRAAGEQVDLRLTLTSDVPPVGLGRGRIEQILLNLTINARDAMPAGGTPHDRHRTPTATAYGSRSSIPATGCRLRSWHTRSTRSSPPSPRARAPVWGFRSSTESSSAQAGGSSSNRRRAPARGSTIAAPGDAGGRARRAARAGGRGRKPARGDRPGRR